VWHSGNAQHADLCKVVDNVHTNAVFRYHTEQQRVETTKDFLATAPHDALWVRVKATYPDVLKTLEAARRGAISTRVPDSCK
jgi:hypothetical protein